jgi:translation initiation factor 1
VSNNNKSQLMYSTASGDPRAASEKQKPNSKQAQKGSSSKVKMRLETAGRGGKAVTVLFDLPWSEQEAGQLLKEMQTKFGCGGSQKNLTLELRGDLRDRVAVFLQSKNISVVRAGG